MLVAARHHARSVFSRFMKATRDAVRVQERVLLDKIRRNADSAFGRDYGFDDIRSVDDFVRRVPVLRYEDHRPYIERVKAGETSAMFGGRQRVHMFALTSGTSDEPKYIPVTEAFLKEYRAGWNAFGVKALLDHPEGFLRRILQVSSRMDETRSAAGLPCGAITGLIAATQKRLVRKYYVSPECLSRVEDPASKYYTIMRLAVPVDVAFMITASPATLLKLARTAEQRAEELIRDVRDGGVSQSVHLPPEVRQELAPRLLPDPAAARHLEGLRHAHGRLLPRHYWNLAFTANWTGGTMGLYLQDFPEYFGPVPVRDIGLVASEGRMSIPITDGTPGGVLEVTSHFFEFVPADRIEDANPPALRCQEVEAGRDYYILLTTSAGLYRYHIGDVVRVLGFEGQAPVIEFLNKGEHTCSLAGEKLTERQLILAMEQVGRQGGPAIQNFVLAPRWGRPPHYVLHLDRASGDGDDLAERVDAALQTVNIEYASRRQTDRLGPVRVNVLPAGYLGRLDHERAEGRRKGNEQYKHRYLYCQPGEDAGFPVAQASSPTTDTRG